MYTIHEQDVAVLNQGLTGSSFPPFIVKDQNGNHVYFGATRAECEAWISRNTSA